MRMLEALTSRSGVGMILSMLCLGLVAQLLYGLLYTVLLILALDVELLVLSLISGWLRLR